MVAVTWCETAARQGMSGEQVVQLGLQTICAVANLKAAMCVGVPVGSLKSHHRLQHTSSRVGGWGQWQALGSSCLGRSIGG